MRGDDVGILLASDEDLVEVARSRPDLAARVPDLRTTGGGAPTIVVGRHGSERPDGVTGEGYLRVEPARPIGFFGWDDDERRRLDALGPFPLAHALVSTSAPLAARLVCLLAERCRLAVDNDDGGIMSGDEFRGLGPDAQVAFIQAKHAHEEPVG